MDTVPVEPAMYNMTSISIDDIYDIPAVEDLVKRTWKDFSEG